MLLARRATMGRVWGVAVCYSLQPLPILVPRPCASGCTNVWGGLHPLDACSAVQPSLELRLHPQQGGRRRVRRRGGAGGCPSPVIPLLFGDGPGQPLTSFPECPRNQSLARVLDAQGSPFSFCGLRLDSKWGTMETVVRQRREPVPFVLSIGKSGLGCRGGCRRRFACSESSRKCSGHVAPRDPNEIAPSRDHTHPGRSLRPWGQSLRQFGSPSSTA